MQEKLVIVMVGLPARGKTYVARKVLRWLGWLGFRTRLFNAGDYRRKMFGAKQDSSFFSPTNPAGEVSRREVAKLALSDLFEWLAGDGDVAIFDATNTTFARRQMIREQAQAELVRTLFVEIICNDESVIDATIRETKVSSPDYADVDPESAERDFRARIAEYASTYEPLGDDEGHYIKYIDKGRQVICNRVAGEPERMTARLLSNLRDRRQPIWLTRHGESLYNTLGLIGGDPDLSSHGRGFAQRLAGFVAQQGEPLRSAQIWTSSLKRTQQTAGQLQRPIMAWRELDEINAGTCEGMTYADIETELPDEFAARKRDKLRYRYPRGESYQDVIQRVSRIALAYESSATPVLIVAHQAVLRVFYAYLMALSPEECTRISVPLHTLIELMPGIYEMRERRIPLT